MRDFSWQVPTQIFFGRDVETTVGEKIRQFGGSRVLLHYGSSFAKKSGLIDRVAGYLKEAGLEFWELGGVK
ncbi:MAG: iron-containing alcohol dehydrogenase, partial [Hornefia butyriciproducens]|nr:iron-containing alcohol dehydrogenase [Hornefia butyriciproducens]